MPPGARWNMLADANCRRYSQISYFRYGRHDKMSKNEKQEFPLVLTITDTEKLRMNIWVRSRNCGCLVTWFSYQLIAKPGNKTATVPWPDPYVLFLQKYNEIDL